MENNQNIGQHLKSIRESKGLRLEDIAHKTKININILRYLESNNFDKLPNKTYVRGFVQNYAKTLGIDIKETVKVLEETLKENGDETSDIPSNPILDQFVEETDLSTELKRHEFQEKITNLIHTIFKKKTIIIVVVVVAGIFTLKHLVNFFGQLKVEGNLNASKKETKVAPPEVIKEEGIKESTENLFDLKVAEKLEAPKEEIKTEAPLEIKKEEEKKVEAPKEVIAEEKKPEVKNLNGQYPYIDFYTAPRNLYTIVEGAPENDDKSLLPDNIRNSMEEGKANVYVKAIDGDTWISFKIDDEKITRYILKQGRHVLLKGDTVLLFMGNINVAKVFYNNELIDANSRTGVKSLIFPEDKAPDYVFPLFPNYKGVPFTASEYQENMAPKPE